MEIWKRGRTHAPVCILSLPLRKKPTPCGSFPRQAFSVLDTQAAYAEAQPASVGSHAASAETLLASQF